MPQTYGLTNFEGLSTLEQAGAVIDVDEPEQVTVDQDGLHY